VTAPGGAGGLSGRSAAAYGEHVRAHGLVRKLPRAAASDHVCWVYEDDDDAFDEALRDFVAGGLERGERLLCVGDAVIDRLRDTGLDELIDSGTLETLTLAEAYAATQEFVPEQQLAYYHAAVQRAVDDGYRGLRVIADVTAIARDPDRRAELVRWEHLADEFSARGAGFSAMCAYSAGLPAEALTEAASVHPAAHAPEALTDFRLFFDDGRLVLAGTVDFFSAPRLAALLAASPAGPDGVVLDVSLLEFLDVAACRTLGRWVRDAPRGPVTIRGASPLFRRMWRLLELDQIAPVAFVAGPST
jgi:anti-anti-sigma regulatory factor